MDSVNNFLFNEIKLKSSDIVVAAISGGPDSMALFHVLLESKIKIGFQLICAHVNHNTGRNGQIEEQHYVERLCKANDILCEIFTISSYHNKNFENEARTLRYDFFEKIIGKYNAHYLFTAHHGDDLVETILMRLMRGSTLHGYSGFSKISFRGTYKIVRPFIELTKDELIEYDKNNKIEYYIDETNFEDIHTRNRIRKYIAPTLKKENQEIHKKFYKFSTMISECDTYIKKQVLQVFSNIYVENTLYIKSFLQLEHLIQIRVIHHILEIIYSNTISSITDSHVYMIYELIISDKSNTYINLPNYLRVIKEYDKIRFTYNNEEYFPYEFEIKSHISLPNGKNIEIVNECLHTDNNVLRLNSSVITLPLFVRNRKDGDKISVKGLGGTKKVKEIFIENKISLNERNVWPIVTDSAGTILWIPGLKKSKFDKPKSEKCDIILKYY